MDNTTYYKKSREILLHIAKNYYKNDKESKQKINIETYLKKVKRKKENMKKIDIIICLTKRSKN